MKFSNSSDIQVPTADAFAQLTDFPSLEFYIMRLGAEVERTDELDSIGVGMSWHVAGNFRGARREVDVTLKNLTPDSRVMAITTSPGYDVKLDFGLIELSKLQSRLKVVVEIIPKTLKSRLIVQSAKLAKSSLDRRFDQRIITLARYLEETYRNLNVA